MKLEVKDSEVEKLVRDCFENYPEYSSPSLQCIKWNYKEFVFRFLDTEENREHVVIIEDAFKGMKKFLQAKLRGELPGIPISNLFDAGEYDATAVDAILQFAIFGKVIYG